MGKKTSLTEGSLKEFEQRIDNLEKENIQLKNALKDKDFWIHESQKVARIGPGVTADVAAAKHLVAG